MMYVSYDARNCEPPHNTEPELHWVCERCGIETFSGLSAASLHEARTAEARARDKLGVGWWIGEYGVAHIALLMCKFTLDIDKHLRECKR